MSTSIIYIIVIVQGLFFLDSIVVVGGVFNIRFYSMFGVKKGIFGILLEFFADGPL